MKNYFKNNMAFVALLALSFIHRVLKWYSIGTFLAQLSFSKMNCATYANFVPLKNSLKDLLLLNSGNYVICANQ